MPSEPLSRRVVVTRALLLALGWIGITAALFGIGQFVVHSHAVADVDRHATHWVVAHRTPALDATMRAVTWLGSWVTVAVAAGIVLVLTLTRRLPTVAPLVVAVAWAGEVATVNLVKHAVDRPRPPSGLWLVVPHGASFPSGHSANATLVGVVTVVVAFLLTRRRATRATAVILACLTVAVVGFSRVELGVHWTTDVLAGCLVALAWSATVAALVGTHAPHTVPGSGSGSGPDDPPSGDPASTPDVATGVR